MLRLDVTMGEAIKCSSIHLVPMGVPLTHEWHPTPHGVIWDVYDASGCGTRGRGRAMVCV